MKTMKAAPNPISIPKTSETSYLDEVAMRMVSKDIGMVRMPMPVLRYDKIVLLSARKFLNISDATGSVLILLIFSPSTGPYAPLLNYLATNFSIHRWNYANKCWCTLDNGQKQRIEKKEKVFYAQAYLSIYANNSWKMSFSPDFSIDVLASLNQGVMDDVLFFKTS